MQVDRFYSVSHQTYLLALRPAVFLLFGLSWAIPPANAEEGGAHTLEEITTALKEWQRSILSFRFQCEGVNEGRMLTTSVTGTKWLVDYAWTERGQRRYSSVGYDAAGAISSRGLTAFDGSQSYRFSYDYGEFAEDKPFGVDIAPKYHLDKLIIGPLATLWVPGAERWLGDELEQRTDVALDGTVEIDGVRCPRVRMPGSNGSSELYIFDPRYDLLPRTWELHPQVGGTFRVTVEEFRRMDETVWFPWRVRREENRPAAEVEQTTVWTMQRVQINVALEESLFKPAIPPGTQVADHVSGRVYIQPGPGMRDRQGERVAALAKSGVMNTQSASGTPVSARWKPRWTSWLASGVAIVAVSLLVLAFWLYRKQAA